MIHVSLSPCRLRAELAAWEAEGQRLAGPGPKKALEKTKALEVRACVGRSMCGWTEKVTLRSHSWESIRTHGSRGLTLCLPTITYTQAAQDAQHSPYLSYVMKQTVALLESGSRVKREALGAATELVGVRLVFVCKMHHARYIWSAYDVSPYHHVNAPYLH